MAAFVLTPAALSVGAPAPDRVAVSAHVASVLDVNPPNVRAPQLGLLDAIAAFDLRLDVTRAPADLDGLATLDPALADATARLLSVLLWAAAERDAAYAAVSDDDLLRFLESETDPEAQSLADRVDHARVQQAAIVVSQTVDAVLPVLERLAALLPTIQAALAAPPLVNLPPVLALDPLGVANTFEDDVALSIDLGGDDVYDNNAGGSHVQLAPVTDPSTCQFNILVGVGCEAQDSAVAFTAALAVDVAGNDHYGVRKTPKFADVACTNQPVIRRVVLQGGGSGGIGMLVDALGDDVYDAKTLSQGHGHIAGVGAFADLAGNDVYQAIRSSQGSGVLGGVGVFLDATGDDDYLFAAPTGGIFNVDAGRCDATARLGLGFGTLASTGHFHDGAGTDTYRIQSQAFGSSSLGFGTFLDADGTDDYGGFPGRGNNQATPSATGVFVDQDPA